jgi:hypothetical protein
VGQAEKFQQAAKVYQQVAILKEQSQEKQGDVAQELLNASAKARTRQRWTKSHSLDIPIQFDLQ